METRGLIIAGVNPVHYGHMALIKTGLQEVDFVDIRVGNKSKCVIPRDVRVEALNEFIFDEGLENRVSVLDYNYGETLADLDVSIYSSLILGSDVLNNFLLGVKRHRSSDRNFFSKFK